MNVPLIAFIGVSAVVIVTPGQDTALTIRNALLGGRRGGTATASGVASGQAIWALFTAGGVAAVLRTSQPAFLAIRLVGAAYVVYLGLQALISAVRARSRHALTAQGRRIRPVSAYRQGLVSNLGNPKMAIFFVSLLPQFAGLNASFIRLLSFGVLFCAMTFAWLTVYSMAVARLGDFLRRERVRRFVDGVTGAVLVAFGLRLATERT